MNIYTRNVWIFIFCNIPDLSIQSLNSTQIQILPDCVFVVAKVKIKV